MSDDKMDPDYIIVGAGSAGCVLADRLSEGGRRKVLVLEAGGSDARFWIKVPLGYGMTFSDPCVNWRYFTEPDAMLNARVAYWPRGRVVGGSSSINAMAYVRGLAHDFDDWERAGASGWNWEVAQRAFERIERHQEPGPDGVRRMRGSGPQVVSELSAQMHPFSARFLDAARELQFPTTHDMNGGAPEGLCYFRSTVRNGARWSAADAFLRRGLRRGNVRLVKNARVRRILIEDGRAVGVVYRVGRALKTVRTQGEVLVSAGSVNSPQLLQLSGVGPARLLQSHGIQVVQDLRHVGAGLQDHLALTHRYIAKERTLNSVLGSRLRRFLAGVQYLLTRKGPLSVPVNQVGGFVRSHPGAGVPDFQVYCNPIAYAPCEGGRPSIESTPGFSLSAQPCRPTSRGEIRIASPDPEDAPLIQPNSLSTQEDCAAAVRAGKLLRKLVSAPALRQVAQAPQSFDGAAINDDALLEDFREHATTNFHPTCTCRMGRSASDSVLDARLKVHGVAGLRVVDASAFPNITSGNTNAPTLMLAARAADLIIEDAARA